MMLFVLGVYLGGMIPVLVWSNRVKVREFSKGAVWLGAVAWPVAAALMIVSHFKKQ